MKAQQQGGDDPLSLAFFELANVEMVGFRLSSKHLKKKNNSSTDLVISARQDTSSAGSSSTGGGGDHTGKIVWETSYLLLSFLLARGEKLGKILEVGAGCGLLGQVLAASKYAKKVVLTECEQVMESLEHNVQRNESILAKNKEKPLAVARKLNWLSPRMDMARFPKDLQEFSFDTIVGTDVVYSQSLVEPLLSTLRIMAHDKTIVYLCLQIRCEDSHKLLLRLASEHKWMVDDISQELTSMPSCKWGLDMECKLLKLTTVDLQQTKKRKSSSTAEAAPYKQLKR